MTPTLPVAEQAAGVIVTAALTAAITFFDLESTFRTAALAPRHARRTGWWWGFLLINAGLSAALWFVLRNYSSFRSWNPLAYSLAVGLAYPALIRLKLATVTVKDQPVPVGLEGLYDGAREYAYARINLALMAQRKARARKLMANNTLTWLGREVRLNIQFDSLASADEKVRRLSELTTILDDPALDEDGKKEALAIILVNGGLGTRDKAPAAGPATRS
jgi:hypothetical protein